MQLQVGAGEMTGPATSDVPPVIAFDRVTKSYDGRTKVLGPVDLTVARGEFLSLVGPSGSGKTTLLMCLAGFELPSAGEIWMNGASVLTVPPHRRNIGVVFQDYALFAHKTVAENIAYPLEQRRVPRAEVRDRVRDALDMVNLAGFADRRPASLSGGQRQRVAVARALVFRPEVVLMDEPLGALDRALRAQLLLELKRLHRLTRATFVYVTHDQEEALAASDRIAVFEGGRLAQLGAPRELYLRPTDLFVAGFVGENNLIAGTCTACDGGLAQLRLPDGSEVRGTAVDRVVPGAAAVATIRPERVSLRRAGQAGHDPVLQARFLEATYLGRSTRLVLGRPDGSEISALVDEVPAGLSHGDLVAVGIDPDECRIFAAPGR
jgi:putative spermidine/putrescine transport system ATP-binding protein